MDGTWLPDEEAEWYAREHVHCKVDKHKKGIALWEHGSKLEEESVTMVTVGVANPEHECHDDCWY